MARTTRSNVSKTQSGNNEGHNNDGRKNRGKSLLKDPIIEEDAQERNDLSKTLEESKDRRGGGHDEKANFQPKQIDFEVVTKFLSANKERFLQFVQDQLQNGNSAQTPKRQINNNEDDRQGSSKPDSPPRQGRRSGSPLRRGRQSKSPLRRGRRSRSPHNREKSSSIEVVETCFVRNRHRRNSTSDDEPDKGIGGFERYGRLITPFTDKILKTPLPRHYKVPNITPYDGLRNPQNFLFQFQYNMINQKLDQVHMCKLFPELLIDNAWRWFVSLPSGSIGSYKDLMRAFHQRFFQKMESKVTSTHLLTVRQRRGESITNFMTRFNKECMKVEDIDDLLIISAFQNGILPGALHKRIVEHEPQTSVELWRIVDRFAKADEANRRKREVEKHETS